MGRRGDVREDFDIGKASVSSASVSDLESDPGDGRRVEGDRFHAAVVSNIGHVDAAAAVAES